MTRLRSLFVGLVLTLPLIVATGGDVSAEIPPANTFHGLTPARLMDTRAGGATVDDLFEKGGAVGPNSVTNLLIAGRGDVPDFGVGAVALNVTGTGPTANTYLTVWPTGTSQPDASNLNLRAAITTPNMVIVPLGADGQISIFNKNGNTDLLVDVLGWFPTGSSFTGLLPARLMDTRSGGATVDHFFEKTGAVGPNSTTNVTILNRGGVPETGVGAVALNVTGTNPTLNTYITVFPTGATQPDASNLNLRAGITTPNMVIVPVGAGGQISLFNKNGNTDLLVDVLGWFPTGPSFTGLVPARILDSREGGGQTIDHLFEAEGQWHPDSIYNVKVLDRGGVPADGVGAVALNVTGTNPTENTFITVWPAGYPRPDASNLNLRAGITTPNMVIVPVGFDGEVWLYNKNGFTDMIVDVLGWFPETEIDPSTIRATVGPAEVEPIGGDSVKPAISGDGRYTAYQSTATNLVTGDLSGYTDIFVYDRVEESTARVSVGLLGAEANGDSTSPAISADGRFITYSSSATNLVALDTNLAQDIFIYDRVTQETTRLNLGPAGVETLTGTVSDSSSVSGDGHFVTFESSATTLVLGDTNSYTDIFVRDTQMDVTTRVSVSTTGLQGDGNGSFSPSISDDGRYVAFHSAAVSLLGYEEDGTTPIDSNSNWDVFVHDRTLGRTTRVSVDNGGNQLTYGGFNADISGDGRFVVYDSSIDELAPADFNEAYDVFIYDQQLGTTFRVSESSFGLESMHLEDSDFASISGDGRYVTYQSESTTFDFNDDNGARDIYVWDRLTLETTWVSVDFDGEAANNSSEMPVISNDGRYIAFSSYATDLVVPNTNTSSQIFLRFMGTI